MRLFGWCKNGSSPIPQLSSFEILNAEYDPDVPGVRFTLPKPFVYDLLLPVDDKEEAEAIVRRSVSEVLFLDKITAKNPMRFDNDEDEDDETVEADELATEKLSPTDKKPSAGRRSRRRWVVAMVVAAILACVLFAPVWNVQIRGDEDPYELSVLVSDAGSDGTSPQVLAWTVMPHDPEPVTLENGSVITGRYQWIAPFAEHQVRPDWPEIDLVMDEDLCEKVPVALGRENMGVLHYDFLSFEVLRSLDDGEVVAVHTPTGKAACYGVLERVRSYSDGSKLYNGARVVIPTMWLQEKQSLFTVLCRLYDTSLDAERINQITLFSAGA